MWGAAEQVLLSLRRAGADPLLLVPGEPGASARALARCDGLLLPGGRDLQASLYGQAPHPANNLSEPEAEADRLEMELVQSALEREVPTLLICRGMQLLNVLLGGELFQHLPEHGLLAHTPGEDRLARSVQVRVEAESRLASLLGEGPHQVACRHHQGISRLAPSLQAAATAEDGSVEAVEHPAHPLLLAVQWHPELSGEGLAGLGLFSWLSGAAGGRPGKMG